MPYDPTNLPSNISGVAGFVPGSSGPDSLDSTGNRVKAGLRSGVSITNAAFALQKTVEVAKFGANGVSAGVSAMGPIGAGVGLALETCLTAYDANDDLGKVHSQISMLTSLLDQPGREETKAIIRWQINKFTRRGRYDSAESAGFHHAKKSIKGSWGTGTKAGKATAAAKTAGYAVAAAPGALVGQVGAKSSRFVRGGLKKVGLMGSQRKANAAELYQLHQSGCPLAQKVITLIMSKGLTDMSALDNVQKKIDDVMKSELAKAMSSYKGT